MCRHHLRTIAEPIASTTQLGLEVADQLQPTGDHQLTINAGDKRELKVTSVCSTKPA